MNLVDRENDVCYKMSFFLFVESNGWNSKLIILSIWAETLTIICFF